MSPGVLSFLLCLFSLLDLASSTDRPSLHLFNTILGSTQCLGGRCAAVLKEQDDGHLAEIIGENAPLNPHVLSFLINIIM